MFKSTLHPLAFFAASVTTAPRAPSRPRPEARRAADPHAQTLAADSRISVIGRR